MPVDDLLVQGDVLRSLVTYHKLSTPGKETNTVGLFREFKDCGQGWRG